ncbi:MAG: DUF131 domain-containing protein [Candidatus Bathyarchaeia archaeon]|jgi:uncharacterized protein (TIGR00304 family)
MDYSLLYTVGFVLIIVGIIVVAVAILVSAGKSRSTEGKEEGSKARGGGVIMIGPIPIIFGTDKKSVKTVLALALALTIALIVWYYLMLR